MGIKDNIEKQLPKENGIINTEEIREQLCEAMSASWPDDSDEPRPEAVKAINDFDEIVKAFESLPVFEDTGERFVHGIKGVWTAFDDKVIRCNGIVFSPAFNKWVFFSTIGMTRHMTDKFYSTRESAEAAMKGGE